MNTDLISTNNGSDAEKLFVIQDQLKAKGKPITFANVKPLATNKNMEF